MTYAFTTIVSRRAAWLAAVGTLAAMTPAQAWAAGISAGSLIQNTATATFSQGGSSETVNSNMVTITVDELLDVAVSSLDGGNVVLTQAGAILRYQVQNSGNGPEAYTIAVDPNLSGDDFNPVVTQIAWDSNANGIYDAGTDAIITTGGTTPSLPADGTGTVFVVTNWATAPADGALANVRLTATAVTGSGPAGTVFAGAGQGGSDAVVGPQNATDNALGSLLVNSASVSLVKSATIADQFGGTEAVPGATVTYRLVAAVSGSASVTGLVVADAIPAGTTYVPASLTLNTAALTDAADGDAGAGSAAGISVSLGTVASGSSHTVTFQVKID